MLRKLSLYLLLLLVLVIIEPRYATANTGLSVSPIRSEFAISPGAVYTGTLNISNSNSKTINIELSASEFNVVNQNYDYVFNDSSELVEWVSFEESRFSLSENKTRQVKYYIGVPNNAEPGGRYISLFTTTDVYDVDGTVISKQRIASLVYFTIDGDILKTGSLIKLNAPWLFIDKAGWSVTIRNSGTTHFQSVYSVKIYSLFGKKTASYQNDSLILPASIKLISSDLPKLSLPGAYVANYSVSLGDSPSESKTSVLLYLPVWFVVLCLVIILLLFIKKFINKNN